MRAAPIALLAITLLPCLPLYGQQFGKAENLAPYIPTPPAMVDRLLKAAHLKPGDTVYDLGSGDGRILIAAAQQYGARGVGIEINPDLCEKARAQISRLGLQDRVTMIHGSALHADLSHADVVTMYLLTSSNERLKPNLDRYLKKGARVISIEFQIRGWRPAELIEMTVAGTRHVFYVYEMGQHQ